MTTLSSPGRIGLTQIHGALGVGIRIGQWLNGSGFEDFEHAFLDLGDGTLIQAEPGGAQIVPLSRYGPGTVHWCDGIYNKVPADVRLRIAAEGAKLKGVPYSFLDYDAIAAHRFGLDTAWLQHYIADSGHLICSQLVDLAYKRGGFQIFSDERWDGFVAPGDIYLVDIHERAVARYAMGLTNNAPGTTMRETHRGTHIG
jgi:hypothetical protein